MTITGVVHHIGHVETFGSGFTKRLLVVNNGKKYDNLLPIDFTKERTALIDGLKVGQTVTVEYDAGGREYNGRYFAQNSGWKLEADQSAPPQNQSAPPAKQSAPPAEDDTELPF
jgi:hypothetical protein